MMQITLTKAKTRFSLRSNACFSKNDVKCDKLRYFALNTRFLHILGFNAMKALRKMQTH